MTPRCKRVSASLSLRIGSRVCGFAGLCGSVWRLHVPSSGTLCVKLWPSAVRERSLRFFGTSREVLTPYLSCKDANQGLNRKANQHEQHSTVVYPIVGQV